MLPMGFGDDWLRFNGIGENVTWGMYNNDKPTEAQKEQLYEVLRWAVSRGLTATFHWHNDRSVHHLLDVLERVNAETPDRRPALVDRASQRRLAGEPHAHEGARRRLADAERVLLPRRGVPRPARRRGGALAPPIVERAAMGIPVGGGTDAHRVMSYNPFVSLQWMLDGKTVGGIAMRAPEELPSRIEALRLYTRGSAWFTFDDDSARLARGRQARRPRGAEQGLPHRADRRDRRHRLAAHHGRRPRRLCRRSVRALSRSSAVIESLRRPVVERGRRRRAADHAGQAQRASATASPRRRSRPRWRPGRHSPRASCRADSPVPCVLSSSTAASCCLRIGAASVVSAARITSSRIGLHLGVLVAAPCP